MKKQLIIAISSLQFLLIQPTFAQMMNEEHMKDMPKQGQMMYDDMHYKDTGCNCNMDDAGCTCNMKNTGCGCHGQMGSMNMRQMMSNSKYGMVANSYMTASLITVLLEWTLMIVGIIAILKWIKKQK